MSISKDPKTKLTLSIDKEILDKAKSSAGERRIPISRMVENYLKFIAKPELYCFKCGQKFTPTEAEVCPKCGWMACPKCKSCRCKLSEETAVAVYHMRKVYEELLGGRVK